MNMVLNLCFKLSLLKIKHIFSQNIYLFVFILIIIHIKKIPVFEIKKKVLLCYVPLKTVSLKQLKFLKEKFNNYIKIFNFFTYAF